MSRESELAAWEDFSTTWTIKKHGEEAKGIKTKVTSVLKTVTRWRPELLRILGSAGEKKRLRKGCAETSCEQRQGKLAGPGKWYSVNR